MPTIITRGAGSAQGLGYASSSTDANFIEDVFSTYLYTGNGSTQTITNGIDLAGEGGLVWTKTRNAPVGHGLIDTVRGGTKLLQSNTTAAEDTFSGYITAFGATGYTLGASGVLNDTYNMASWTFRKQPKFFDVVTYTGDGVAGRTVAHNLGSVPGCMMVKSLGAADQGGADGFWFVYHRGLSTPQSGAVFLNSTDGRNGAGTWNNTLPTSTVFSLGGNSNTNINGRQYVAYLFAHDAGGFGLTGTDNVISCGSFTTDGSGNATVSLGYEPQWFLRKETSSANDWVIFDNMRGWSLTNDAFLYPNSSSAEISADRGNPTATGFTLTGQNASANFIYIAIRRGPMKVPTSGTSVYNAIERTGTGAAVTVTGVGFPPDLVINKRNDVSEAGASEFHDKLRGRDAILKGNLTDAEINFASPTQDLVSYDMDGVSLGIGAFSQINFSGRNNINWFFRRAPGFFDVVCYTGTSANQTISHNLGVIPELIINKCRSNAGMDWYTYVKLLDTSSNGRGQLRLNEHSTASDFTMLTAPPTSTNFIASGGSSININTRTYVNYLFATVAGVSKVGSYTGTGTTQVINCGFTSGARFVLIKRTDLYLFPEIGPWYVWDSARGIVAGNDPYLLLNSTAAEVTNTDFVDTAASGFEISSTAPAAINASGGSFIFLAIA